MEPEALVQATRVVELKAKSRRDAIEELVRAGDWEAEAIATATIVEAIEDREAAAQTLVAPDMALPHASIDWAGDYRVVLGRSRGGITYGVAADVVHLVALLVVGRGGGAGRHLEVLARLAKLLEPREFRSALIHARHVKEIARLLAERAARRPAERPQAAELARRNTTLVERAVELAQSLDAQAILLAVDRSDMAPWDALDSWPRRLLLVTSEGADDPQIARRDTSVFDIPHANLSRMDLANMGLLLAAADGLVHDRAEVVCVTGSPGQAMDCISVARPSVQFRAMFSGKPSAGHIPPTVILRVLSLAVELASEGREGRPVGAMFVIGDTRQVTRYTQQLVLNPFHGFNRRLRNLLDPSLTETVKEFALLDGAFIIQADGTALSAGTYLVPQSCVTDLPGGLGTRHQAAAAITVDTRALAIAVSQSTGTVTVFQDGGIVLSLERAMMTRW